MRKQRPIEISQENTYLEFISRGGSTGLAVSSIYIAFVLCG